MFHGMLFATLILALLTLVSASLYPVQPIQNTVYYAGQTVLTRWIDDGTYPLLSNMGGITIQLWYDSDMYLGTLATNVSPGAKAWQFDIPRSLVHDSSNFTLRYITNTPYDMIIYSADFTIVIQGDSLPTSTSASSSLGVTSSSTSTSQNLFFQATSASSPSAPSSSGSETPTPSATNIVMPPLRPGDVGNINQPAGNSRNSGGRIDIEKLKFRVVFILWPALLGVTMAL
ncbi:hypothetical protein DEU56DRAFT_961501 [Suillus clintonianus]|uniref:uncharacterized protein n=1 Tax=Suillus clintonianus TaxID=1904413 RepID=UPI001B864531|nr:uncharacterized protein DEU56DRAFT_961501 [Suillus clintonianus]KAG2125691.1 hypothetical protein DEU56DRAFT_961501 [Suillus clintonianus]